MKKSDARSLAMAEMRKHGLILAGWRFKFDNAKMRLGQTAYRAQIISLSAPLVAVNDEATILDTIRHEIAHALVGPSHGHDAVWRSKARSIGGLGVRQKPESMVVTLEPRYSLTCANCGLTVTRHRRASRPQACPDCCDKYNRGKFTVDYLMVWGINKNAAVSA